MFVVAIHLYLPIILNFNNDITFLILPLPFIIWGGIAGLLSGGNMLSGKALIANPFWVLFVSSIYIVIMAAIWIQVFDPIEFGNYFHRIYSTIFSAVDVLPFIIIPFAVGYAVVTIIRFFSLFIFSQG